VFACRPFEGKAAGSAASLSNMHAVLCACRLLAAKMPAGDAVKTSMSVQVRSIADSEQALQHTECLKYPCVLMDAAQLKLLR
jgi:hypothetical protein